MAFKPVLLRYNAFHGGGARPAREGRKSAAFRHPAAPGFQPIAARWRFAIFVRSSKQGADMAQESEYKVGSMDISDHRKTYEGFLTVTRWSFAAAVLLMIFLAIFRTS